MNITPTEKHGGGGIMARDCFTLNDIEFCRPPKYSKGECPLMCDL